MQPKHLIYLFLFKLFQIVLVFVFPQNSLLFPIVCKGRWCKLFSLLLVLFSSLFISKAFVIVSIGSAPKSAQLSTINRQ